MRKIKEKLEDWMGEYLMWKPSDYKILLSKCYDKTEVENEDD